MKRSRQRSLIGGSVASATAGMSWSFTSARCVPGFLGHAVACAGSSRRRTAGRGKASRHRNTERGRTCVPGAARSTRITGAAASRCASGGMSRSRRFCPTWARNRQEHQSIASTTTATMSPVTVVGHRCGHRSATCVTTSGSGTKVGGACSSKQQKLKAFPLRRPAVGRSGDGRTRACSIPSKRLTRPARNHDASNLASHIARCFKPTAERVA